MYGLYYSIVICDIIAWGPANNNLMNLFSNIHNKLIKTVDKKVALPCNKY